MAKQFLAIEDLTSLVLNRIRQCWQGRRVREISIYELESGHLGRNWDVTIVSPGKRGIVAARRAVHSVISELGPCFDLADEAEGAADGSSEAVESSRTAPVLELLRDR